MLHEKVMPEFNVTSGTGVEHRSLTKKIRTESFFFLTFQRSNGEIISLLLYELDLFVLFFVYYFVNLSSSRKKQGAERFFQLF